VRDSIPSKTDDGYSVRRRLIIAGDVRDIPRALGPPGLRTTNNAHFAFPAYARRTRWFAVKCPRRDGWVWKRFVFARHERDEIQRGECIECARNFGVTRTITASNIFRNEFANIALAYGNVSAYRTERRETKTKTPTIPSHRSPRGYSEQRGDTHVAYVRGTVVRTKRAYFYLLTLRYIITDPRAR